MAIGTTPCRYESLRYPCSIKVQYSSQMGIDQMRQQLCHGRVDVSVWDATRPDTFAPSYVWLSNRSTGRCCTRQADQAEQRKKAKYAEFVTTHHYAPVAIKTMGAFEKRHKKSLLRRVCCIREETEEPLYLITLLTAEVCSSHTEGKCSHNTWHNAPR